ncbi:MAG: phosphoribosyltransferase family protein [Cyclobacteriaceae bacterium]
MCTKCIVQLPFTNDNSFDESLLLDKFLGRLEIKNAWAFLRFRKAGAVQQLLHQLKYNNKPEIGVRLGKIAGEQLIRSGFNIELDMIIPVPLHPSRQRNRGYNQSAKFAEGLSEALKVPVNQKACRRLTNTKTQTKKTREERWENVEKVFQIINPDQLKNKKVLLVDDIITTGATFEACGHILLKAECKELSMACIAHAQ